MKEKTKSSDIELWKSALMTMPDNSFFELLRSIFGKIKSPFNKQQLLRDLENFFLREDIQKTIMEYIDSSENEKKIITAISLFGKPIQEELERFFEDEFNHMQLHDIILNLEERLILFRIKDNRNNCRRLALNPILKKTLAPFTANIQLLFPQNESIKNKKNAKTSVALNDRILAGLLSFVLQYDNTAFYKQEGQLRKQIIETGIKIFSDLDLEKIFGTLQILGLFYRDGENLYPDSKRFTDIAALSTRERMEYCAAGYIVYKEAGNPAEIQAPYYKNRLKEAVNFIHALMDSVSNLTDNSGKETNLSESTLIKLIEVLKSKTGYIADTNILLEALHNFSLLIPHCSFLIAHSSLSIDSASSIFVYPEINFTDAIELAGFTNIKEAGVAVRFELDKDSAVRAYNNGFTAQNVIDTLNRLSQKKVPETLAYNLKDWEKRHGEVSLRKGIVLTLSKDKHFLAKTKLLSALITETLAPGIYLLNEDSEKSAAAALHNAGVDIVARKKCTKEPTQTKTDRYFLIPSSSIEIIPKTGNTKSLKKDNQSDKIIQNFHALLGKMQMDKTSRDELSARINRKLILSESQLKDANIRYEKLEARHMDYAGKQNIAKQAIALGSLTEIIYPAGKSTKQIYGYPKALDKENGITLVAVSADDNKELRIPLAKISLLRRIKKSIFEG